LCRVSVEPMPSFSATAFTTGRLQYVGA
jgi:hypothetical protein